MPKVVGWFGRHWTMLLLVAVPIAGALQIVTPDSPTAIFLASIAVIVPLAALIGRATDWPTLGRTG